MTLIAAVEAYRMTGWEATHQCVLDLYADLQKVLVANQKVNLLFRILLTSIRMMPVTTTMMVFQMSNRLMQKTWSPEKHSYF